eukprot:TRINITY_DN37200_c0_g1_i2.p1 TRINITY_DN37200_c0_g1~~TRINITY_DN37200_c0_g1_i2.p1  ORF type:complete len:176 (+),score=5.32 TRINITY_DN37200_c0_g1_i2:61-528(+)
MVIFPDGAQCMDCAFVRIRSTLLGGRRRCRCVRHDVPPKSALRSRNSPRDPKHFEVRWQETIVAVGKNGRGTREQMRGDPVNRMRTKPARARRAGYDFRKLSQWTTGPDWDSMYSDGYASDNWPESDLKDYMEMCMYRFTERYDAYLVELEDLTA